MPKADLLTAGFLILVSLYVMFESYFRTPRFKEWEGFYASPGFVPFLLGFGLLLMSLLLLLRAVRQRGYVIGVTGEGIRGFFRNPAVLRFFLCWGLFILFYLLLGRIPFAVDTGLFVFLFILVFRGSGWPLALAVSIGTALVVSLVFSRLFLIPLP